jgi:hypothetical protein
MATETESVMGSETGWAMARVKESETALVTVLDWESETESVMGLETGWAMARVKESVKVKPSR